MDSRSVPIGLLVLMTLVVVVNDSDNKVTSALAEFGPDAPEKRPGAEITATIDAGSIPNVLYVGRPAVVLQSNSEGTLFRLDGRSGIADRVPSVTAEWIGVRWN